VAAHAWHTSYEAAMADAERTGRPVLTVFTGSDWCPHCKTLEKNVLETGAFHEWAERNVVLLMIDLPQHGITEAVRVERSKVCIKYGVRNFPAVLLISPDGTKLAEKRGYQGQSPAAWIADMTKSLPERPAETAVAAMTPAATSVPASTPSTIANSAPVLDSLDKAIETARGAKRPILLVVARPGDKAARSHSDSLISDPEFAPFVQENFIVAHVPPTASSGSQEAESMENLLGGVELAPDAVELIVTDDGQTPLFSQSGAQPPARIVHGLRRFLAARQASRFGETAPRR
jgi:thiol-disulfide isomerase/thioredoxin